MLEPQRELKGDWGRGGLKDDYCAVLCVYVLLSVLCIQHH